MRAYNDRLDPFTDTMHSVSVTNELHRIPTIGDPVIKLREVPLLADPSTLSMRVRDLLAAAITSTGVTSITPTDIGWYVAGDVLTIDSEKLQVATVGASTLTVTRAYGGTTAAIHSVDAPIYIEGSMSEINAIPSAGQFYPDYYTQADKDDNYNGGQILFNSADAGKIVAVNYDKTGAQADDRVVKVAMPDHIVEGLTMEPIALIATVNPGKAWISNELVEIDEVIDLYLQARRAQLAYIGLDGLPAKLVAAFPAADASSVVRWIIDGNPTIASTIGSNTLTKSGTVNQVYGWAADFAGQGNGSNGYYVSANSNNFPTGTATRSVTSVFTVNSIPGSLGTIYDFGNIQLALGADALLYVYNSSGADLVTSFICEVGKTYCVEERDDNSTGQKSLYVNGQLVFSGTNMYNGTPSLANIFRHKSGSRYIGAVTVHYVELRNALRTPAEIAAVSNALILPYRYNGEAYIPTMTSNTAPRGAASASAEYSATYAAWKAMDSDENTYWQPSASGATGTLQYQSTVGKAAKSYTVRGGVTYYPTAWEFRGSNDGSTWTVLDVKLGQKTGSARTYQLNNKATFTYYQLNITASSGAGLQIVTFQVDVAAADIRAILPADTHSLGFLRTDEYRIIEKDDHSYKYGRREGISGGNREEFLGWQYYSTGVTLEWPNPFGNRKVDAVYKWAEDRDGRNESDVVSIFYSSASTYYGIQRVPNMYNPFRITTQAGGVTCIDGVTWKTIGYIGCYGRVIEDE